MCAYIFIVLFILSVFGIILFFQHIPKIPFDFSYVTKKKKRSKSSEQIALN